MAYVSSALNLTSMSPLESNFKEWNYVTTDNEATVKGAGYISDAGKKGMSKGDIVFVVNQATPACYLLQVASLTGTGYAATATLGATVVVT
jgi:hypothetical protein